jgi:hypothetical protein
LTKQRFSSVFEAAATSTTSFFFTLTRPDKKEGKKPTVTVLFFDVVDITDVVDGSVCQVPDAADDAFVVGRKKIESKRTLVKETIRL